MPDESKTDRGSDPFVLLSAIGDLKGTRVWNREGEELGRIDDVMIDAHAGNVVYGILQFGGFLGVGSDHYAIPFGRLHYDHELHGYVTDLTKEDLEAAPAQHENWQRDREWRLHSYEHYGVPPYWL